MRGAIGGIIFDIDGTVARGRRVLTGVVDVLSELRRRGIPFAFFTNDNSHTVAAWVDRLAAMGIEAAPDEVVTSAIVAAEVTSELHPSAAILPVGDSGLLEALQAKGLMLLDDTHVDEAEVVVMGRDPHFDQERLALVCRAIWGGAEFLATNYDPRIPTSDGFAPATGPMVKAVAYATGREPLVTGKPSSWSGTMAMRALGLPPQRGAIVGDQLATDIAMGKNAGMHTILVLTGDATREDATTAPPQMRPDVVLSGVDRLLDWMDGGEASDDHEVMR